MGGDGEEREEGERRRNVDIAAGVNESRDKGMLAFE
jgi:hypothetical protein